MDSFLPKPNEERETALNEAEARLGVPARIVEKDFWVCWTLRELFALPGHGPQLTFKGGTSLSKGWRLIERFSEDIDVVIDRESLGFKGALGSSRLEKLRVACSERIVKRLLPDLKSRLQARLPRSAKWDLLVAGTDEDPDEQTLLFEYPTVYAQTTAYVRPAVKNELGARSETEPAESPTIRPLLSDAFGALLPDGSFAVKCVVPRRTFWEKAMLLHEETYRPDGKKRKPRLSRHYYDLWCLTTKGVAAEAMADAELFERVAAHRRAFFRYGWMDYGTLKKGSLRIVPLPEHKEEWRRDYAAMQPEMFVGTPPSFDLVLKTVAGFEKQFNQS